MFIKASKTDRKKTTKREPLKKKVFKKRPCKFCMDKVEKIDYLDYQKLGRFMTERGKIVPSRISGNCAKHQRQLAKAIKKARVLALLPFVAD
ncbi:MAG: 30S ribosomal protein S18 [Candidatus Omnitrophica bacterium]|nr:30S ribosomal protein S18 [Candidatus Omnitrophota bacterium]MCM8791182.1 30S ribosomal protein S18 [Candidatus Omnitrophota bacterium]